MRSFLCLMIVLAGLGTWSTPSVAQTTVPQTTTEITLSFAPLVKEAAPAVVNIFANRLVEASTSPFMGNEMFEDFMRETSKSRPRVQNSLGSGVILSSDGIVVTNYHVVGMATEIRVVLNDRREFQARLLLSDQESDIAILKIDSDTPLPWLKFRNSDQVEVGELVLAIGNPFGIGQTVSSGIISGLARSGVATGNARGYFIQTDAPINPGNSGGALIDVTGRLIGVNTSILTRSGGSNGLGFAIPSNLVARFVDQAIAGETRFFRPWAGINGQSVTAEIAQGFGLSVPEGVVITAIHPQSPFANAGLNVGNIVLSVDGAPVNSPAEMIFRMSVRSLGEQMEITYLSTTRVQTALVDLISAPEIPPRDLTTISNGALAGLTVSNINPAVQSELSLPTSIEGVVVVEVKGVLRSNGLQAGDVILGINGTATKSAEDVDAISQNQTENWQLDGVRGSRRFSVRLRL